MAGLMSDAEKGETYWVDAQHYYKGWYCPQACMRNADSQSQPTSRRTWTKPSSLNSL